MSDDFYNSALNAVRTYVEREHNGVVSHAKTALGMTSDTLDKWLRGERKPSLSKLAPILEQLNARILVPGFHNGSETGAAACLC